jgi:ABC-type uncharacterized transport system auxiliary subunit
MSTIIINANNTQNRNTTKYVLDTTMCMHRHDPSHKQLEAKTNRISPPCDSRKMTVNDKQWSAKQYTHKDWATLTPGELITYSRRVSSFSSSNSDRSCLCMHIVVSNTYFVVFLFCVSSSCVPYLGSFSGSSIFLLPLR